MQYQKKVVSLQTLLGGIHVDEVNCPRFLFVYIQSKNNIKTKIIMKKQLLLFAMILLPLVASAHDIEVQNADGVTILLQLH